MSTYAQALKEWRRAYLERALRKADGNLRKAARSIGVSRHIFYKRGFASKSKCANRGNGTWQELRP